MNNLFLFYVDKVSNVRNIYNYRYINGLLIPEINVVRGKTYTFVVEGGNDPDIPAKYHPL